MVLRRLILILSLISLSSLLIAAGHRVLFIGDSITDGAWGNSKAWNASSDERNQRDMNHIYGHGYMMITASCYEAKYPEAQWTFWNRGISGNTLNDLANRWQHDVLDLQPDVVSILIGTNDVAVALKEGHRIDPVAWETCYRALLDQVLSQNPSVRFVLCTPFVAEAGKLAGSADYGERTEMIHSLVDILHTLSHDYNATLVPFDQLIAESIASTPTLPVSYWVWDGIHPTPAMHYRMAEMWMQCVNLFP